MSSEKCPKCGNPIAENDIFCGNCGVKIEKPKGLRCANCGQPVNTGDTFCGNCGAKIIIADTSSPASPQNKHTIQKIIIISVIICVIIAVCGVLVYFCVQEPKSKSATSSESEKNHSKYKCSGKVYSYANTKTNASAEN